MFPESLEFHVSGYVNDGINWLLESFAPTFDSISAAILTMLLAIQGFLGAVPWWAYILLVAVATWLTVRKWTSVVILSALPMLIGMFGLWDLAVDTLAIIVAAVFLSLLFGIPLGVLMAEFRKSEVVLKPLLDGMQTMPSFVYLIPAMMLFGLGKVPAVFATLIYSMPPVIRLTSLGLTQVPVSV